MTFKRTVLDPAALAVVALLLSGCNHLAKACVASKSTQDTCWADFLNWDGSQGREEACERQEEAISCTVSRCGHTQEVMDEIRDVFGSWCSSAHPHCPRTCDMIEYGTLGNTPAISVGKNFQGTLVSHGKIQKLFTIGDNFHGTVVNHGQNTQTSDYKMEVQSVDHSKNVHFAQQQIKDCEGSGNGDSDGAAQVVCCKSEGAVCCASAAFNGGEVGTESSQCPANHPYIQRWVEVPNNKPAPSQLLVYVSFGAVALLVLGCVACAWQRIKARRATSNIDDETLVE